MERCGCWLSFCRVCKSLMELNRGSLQDESISLALVWRPGLAHSKWKVPKAGKGQSPCESDGSFCSSLVSLYLSICLFVYLFINSSICLSVCLSVSLFVCLLPQQVIFFQIWAFHLDRWELGGKALRSGTPRTMTMYDMEAGHFPSAKPVGCDMRFFFLRLLHQGRFERYRLLRQVVVHWDHTRNRFSRPHPGWNAEIFLGLLFHFFPFIKLDFAIILPSFSYLQMLFALFSRSSILRPSWLLTLSWGTTGTPTPR